MSNHDEDRAAAGGSARYGHGGPGSGANEPKRHEKKEQREDWVPRQGGDQTDTGRQGEARDRDEAERER
jgi:hypothetical protein